jgi:hypothetical protein
MDRQVARWHELLGAGGPRDEGWASVEILDRDAAARIDALRFVGARRPAIHPAAAA